MTGGTGFVGAALCGALADAGHDVTVLTRDAARARAGLPAACRPVESLERIAPGSAPEAVVNLAGRSLGSARWNEARKHDFVRSRVETTARVVAWMRRATPRPRVLVSGSAVGYYGARGDEALDEDAPPGREYQSALCVEWERAARAAEPDGVRVCLIRMGVVLAAGGGALSSLLPSFGRGLGGWLGDGRQWMPWVHRDDVTGAVRHLVGHDDLAGPFNLAAPGIVTNREFARTLGDVLARPARLRVPAWAVRLQAGEMARLFLTGQHVVPSRLLASGYRFRHPDLRSALRACLD